MDEMMLDLDVLGTSNRGEAMREPDEVATMVCVSAPEFDTDRYGNILNSMNSMGQLAGAYSRATSQRKTRVRSQQKSTIAEGLNDAKQQTAGA